MGSAPVQDKAERDQLIEEASQEFPEYSYLDRVQERIYEEARERGPNMSYPEYEGPGFTEPAANDPGLHEDHSEYERDHYWDDPEDVARDTEEAEWLNMGGDPAIGSAAGVPDQEEHYREFHAAADDARQFEQYYGEPPTPAEELEAG